MRAAGFVVMVGVFVPLAAQADVKGSYKRVGGWQYVELDKFESCGAQVRKAFADSLAKARYFTVTKTEIRMGTNEKGFEIKKRERTHVMAKLDLSDKDMHNVWSVDIAETSDDTVVMFGRMAGTPDGSQVCADLWRASVEQQTDEK